MNTDPKIKMSSHYVATGHTTPYTTWGTGYSPAQLEAGGSTGFRGLLPETLITNSGSGSWFENVFLLLGTSLVWRSFAGEWPTISINVGEDPTPSEEDGPLTTAEKLNVIRDAFGLSMAALADVLNASRASLYNWFEAEPRSDNVTTRIDRLYRIACDWQEMNPYHFAPGKLMKQRLGDEPSMMERLSRKQLDSREIADGMESLLTLMNKQRDAMDRAKARSARAKNRETHKNNVERFTSSITVDKD